MSNYIPNSNNDITFSCEYSTIFGNVNFVFPDQRCINFDVLNCLAGENSFIDGLYVFTPWYLYSGENVVVDGILIYRFITLDSATSGEVLAPKLTLFYGFKIYNYTGEYSDSDLTTRNPITLTLDSNYTGEYSDSDLTTYKLIEVSFSSDENSAFGVSFFDPPILRYTDSISGEFYELGLYTLSHILIEQGCGDVLFVDLITRLAPELNTDNYTGEVLTPSLYCVIYPETNNYTGCSSKATLQIIEYLSYSEIPTYTNCSTSVVKDVVNKTITLTVPASSGNTCGANFQTPVFVINRTESEFLDVSFTRTQSGTWYDDDGTDADCIVYLFATSDYNLSYNSNANQYYKPSEDSSSPPPSPKPFAAFRLRKTYSRFNTIGAGASLSYNSAYGTDYNKQRRNTLTSDAYNGSLLTFRVKPNATNSNFDTFQFLENGIVIEELIGPIPSDTFYFVVHFHDYNQSDEASELISGIYANQGSISSYFYSETGENFNVDLTNYIRIIYTNYSGEVLSSELITHPSFPLSLNSQYTDSYSEVFNFTTYPKLSVINYSGEVLSSTLTAYPFANLDTSNYSGEVLIPKLSTTASLDSINYVGEVLSPELTTHPFASLVIPNYTGEVLIPKLSTAVGLVTINYAGEILTPILTSFPFASLVIPNYAGEYLVPNLSTTYVISDVNGYCDEISLTNIDFYPFAELDITQSEGSELTFILSTKTKFFCFGYSGENLTVNFTTKPFEELSINGYCGELSLSSLYVPFALYPSINYTGSTAVVDSIYLTPNIYCYSGENFTLELATQEVWHDFDFYAGENLLWTLDTHPSGPIGMLRGYAGQNYFPTLTSDWRINLYVLIKGASSWLQVDVDSATYFDLKKDCLCGPRQKEGVTLDIHLEDAEYYDDVASGDYIIFSVDLHTAKRFKVNFYNGQECTLKDYSKYLEVDFAVRLGQMSFRMTADGLRHRLCKGYFIPSAYNLLIELKDLLLEDCEVHRFYTGETLFCVLSDDQVQQVETFITGQTVYASIETSPPLRFSIYTGEYADVDQSYYRTTTGESCTIKFYEPDMYAYTGSIMTCGELVSLYYVKFDETGCLDNEFQYQNLAGDLVPELFTPILIEGAPFKHEIKASCFDAPYITI